MAEEIGQVEAQTATQEEQHTDSPPETWSRLKSALSIDSNLAVFIGIIALIAVVITGITTVALGSKPKKNEKEAAPDSGPVREIVREVVRTAEAPVATGKPEKEGGTSK
jgi:hypothetical protein